MSRSEKEQHLIIIWENARAKEAELLKEIENNFTIIATQEVSWTKKIFSANLSRFYGLKLAPYSGKEEHCGNGTFLCVFFEVKNPEYRQHQTSKGPKTVNSDVFLLKEKLRQMTGGGHKIHATNDPKEFLHDTTLLFGPEFKVSDIANYPKVYKKDTIGTGGWKNLREIFDVLNNSVEYVVMRNFDTLPSDTPENHADIDLIVENTEETALILGAKKVFPEEYRIHYAAQTNKGKKIYFDLRYPGDGYYDKKWEQDLLDKRVKNKKKLYVADTKNHFFSLLYHALLHKAEVSPDYVTKLTALGNELGIKGDDVASYQKLMVTFLRQSKYKITEPDDRSVVFQRERAQRLSRSIRKERLLAPLRRMVK